MFKTILSLPLLFLFKIQYHKCILVTCKLQGRVSLKFKYIVYNSLCLTYMILMKK